MKLKNSLIKVRDKYRAKNELLSKSTYYVKKFERYSFMGNKCIDERQYEAVITRWYHTIEKGLSYLNYRAGFGKANIDSLLTTMENYLADGYSADAFFFKTALCTLEAYLEKNKSYGVENEIIAKRVVSLGGTANRMGGIIKFFPLSDEAIKTINYADFVKNRHSIRCFSLEPVNIERVKNAISLAQYTPSACNRQGWRSRVICNKDILATVLSNQNGNEGFGHKFDKLILVTADLRCFNRDRELYQAYIDGGMYAQSILNALHYEHIATVPLSASLKKKQEKNVRRVLGIHDAEVFIMFIGIGNYPEECQTTRSERRSPDFLII